MQDFPHHYVVTASSRSEGEVAVEADGVPAMSTAPPEQFGGPGDHWSPEMMLVGAVADCVALSFRAVARASRYDWDHLSCRVEGTLDRVDRVTQFTHFTIHATLAVPDGADLDRARLLLEKAERNCLVSNSLKAESTLDARVVVSSG